MASDAVPAGAAEQTPEQRKNLRRAIAASAMGNATEWYDYSVYGYLTVTIGKVFFPADAQGTLLTLGIFAASFLIRPLGGIVLGPLGDRLGRRKVLAFTIILMSLCTFLIGLIPSYASIGIGAPLLLLLLRLVQGFSTGGEYGGAATFMAEYAPDNKRGFLGSFLEFGTLSGYIVGAGVTTICSLAFGDAGMTSFGWRIPFLLGLPLGIVGLYLRSRLEETPVFKELEAAGEREKTTGGQFKDLLLNNWRPILVCMGLVLMLNVTDYTLLTYMPTYLNQQIGMTANTGLIITIIVYVVMLAVISQVGRLSDRIGRKPLWYASAVGFLVLAIPAFLVMSRGMVPAVIGFLVLGLLLVLQLGTISATFPALFPTQVRYAGFAISYNVSTSLFGGTAPAVIAFLITKTGTNLIPAYYVMGACVVGIVALLFAPETARASLRGTEVPDAAKGQAAPAEAAG